MAVEGEGLAYPQVFVVDSQASYARRPGGRSPGWGRARRKLLPCLVGVALCGLAVQACCLYYLHNKMEGLQRTAPHQGSIQGRTGSREESNEIPDMLKPRSARKQHKPSAHLTGPSSALAGGEQVIRWEVVGEAYTNLVNYLSQNGSLVVAEEGFYYVYSNVQFYEVDNSLFKHTIMKLGERYPVHGQELMKAKRYHGPGERTRSREVRDYITSFLGGVFHLHVGDIVYVTVSDGSSLRLGNPENFMGLFMI